MHHFMAHAKKPRPTSNHQSSAPDPVWYQPEAPLGSAVRYLASLSSRFDWVGIYFLKGQFLELGPFLGKETEHTRIPVGKGICGLAVRENKDQNVPNVQENKNYLSCSVETRSELVVLIRDKKSRILGQIDIDSHTENAFGAEEEEKVRQVALELGERWPE